MQGDDDIYDALRDAVKALGGAASVGKRLRPECPVPKAERWLLDAINPNREQKLDPQQFLLILRWAREAGFHDAMSFVCDNAGYDCAKPKHYADQLHAAEQRLLRVKTDAEEAVAAVHLLIQAKSLTENPRLVATMRHAGIKVEDL